MELAVDQIWAVMCRHFAGRDDSIRGTTRLSYNDRVRTALRLITREVDPAKLATWLLRKTEQSGEWLPCASTVQRGGQYFYRNLT